MVRVERPHPMSGSATRNDKHAGRHSRSSRTIEAQHSMAQTASDAQYVQAVEDFDALRKLIPTFRNSRAWLRDADYPSERIRAFVPPGVPITKGVLRDYVVCALA